MQTELQSKTNEFEYRYLVDDLAILNTLAPFHADDITQGYLTPAGAFDPVVRVRITQPYGDLPRYSEITVKGKAEGIGRPELEYEIPVPDAETMLDMCGMRVIIKTRYSIKHGDHVIELDCFSGKLSGLVIAEVEVKSRDEVIVVPEWFGEDISTNKAYSNSTLACLNDLKDLEALLSEQKAIELFLAKPWPTPDLCGCLGPEPIGDAQQVNAENFDSVKWQPACPCGMDWVVELAGEYWQIRGDTPATATATKIGPVGGPYSK